MDYREKLGSLGIEVHKIRGSQGKVICPKCSHGRKKKKDPCLSVNISEGWYNCWNCEWSGNVVHDMDDSKSKRTYTRPVFNNRTSVDKSIVDWFGFRGIGQNTILKNKITQDSLYFPQANENRICMNFNYFRNGELINIKSRDHEKNFRLSKDAELIFYGIDDLKETDEYILITEGEIDKMSWNEAGIYFAISVPNGASNSSNSTLEYLDNCWDYFKNDKIVILATDNDNPGMILREELSRRIGKDRCRKVDFKDVKDSNDYLLKYGKEGLYDLIKTENLIEYPLKGVVDIDDYWDDVEFLMDNGLPKGKTTGYYEELDELISFDGSKLCVVTGMPNSGKSPTVDQLMIILSIKYGWKWGICSMESKPTSMYIVKMVEKIIGKFIRPGKPVSAELKERVRIFLRNHFYFIEPNYENNESDTLDFIFDSAQSLVRKYGIKGLTIDPWNKIEHKMKSGENETNYISRVLDEIIRFEQKHDLFTFLVAHPAKPKKTKGGEYEVPDLYSVSGSSNFYNKPDWGMTVHRNFKSGLTEIHINKAKWDHLGKRGSCALKYNGGNGRLVTFHKDLDFSNWLDSLIFSENKGEDYVPYTEEVFIHNNGEEPQEAPF